jgi:hypothetical protein
MALVQHVISILPTAGRKPVILVSLLAHAMRDITAVMVVE